MGKRLLVHADDFGITVPQAKRLMDLIQAKALQSVSIFANSPAFPEAAALLKPAVDQGLVDVAVHINLVEGPACATPNEVGILLSERKGADNGKSNDGQNGVLINGREGKPDPMHLTFAHGFVGLLKLSLGSKRQALHQALVRECTAQITTFLEAFPEQQDHIQVDSHQHAHAIPMVFDALLEALHATGCTIQQMRIPTEQPQLYRTCKEAPAIPAINHAKILLINALMKRAPEKLARVEKEQGSAINVPRFAGIAYSGQMFQMNEELVHTLWQKAQEDHADLEILFHPVSVPINECLDPNNVPFAQACASPNRDKEAEALQRLFG